MTDPAKLAALAALAACSACTTPAPTRTACPVAMCSDATPNGLVFVGTDIFAPDQPVDVLPVTAVGGTQEVRIMYDPQGDGVFADLDLPYEAMIVGTGAVVAHSGGAIVGLRGLEPGTSELHIIDPHDGSVYDVATVVTRDPTRALVFTSGEQPMQIETAADLGPAVFAAGDVPLVFAISGDPTDAVELEGQLVDTSMTVAGPVGASQPDWNVLEIPAAVAGAQTITLTIGALALHVPIRIAAGADTLALVGDPAQSVHAPRQVCFVASNAGDAVRGLTWTFSATGGLVTATDAHDRCPVIAGTGGPTVTVHVSAGGLSSDFTFPAT